MLTKNGRFLLLKEVLALWRILPCATDCTSHPSGPPADCRWIALTSWQAAPYGNDQLHRSAIGVCFTWHGRATHGLEPGRPGTRQYEQNP